MAKKLKYYGGNGFDTIINDKGHFTVKMDEDLDKEFTDLTEAKKFYDSLNEEKAFWDDTTIPELIDCWTY